MTRQVVAAGRVSRTTTGLLIEMETTLSLPPKRTQSLGLTRVTSQGPRAKVRTWVMRPSTPEQTTAPEE